MKKSICAAAFLGTIFVPVIAARSQCSNGVCGNPMPETVPCQQYDNSGNLICSQTAVIRMPSGGAPFDCWGSTFIWCCNRQLPDFGSMNFPNCDNHSSIPRKELLELAMTHTVWLTDCSGHAGPFAVSWTVPEKTITLKPKLTLN